MPGSQEPSTKILEERVRQFMVDNERGKTIGIRAANVEHVLKESSVDGHFTGTIHISVAQAGPFLTSDAPPFGAIASAVDRRRFHSAGLRRGF